MGSLTEAEAQSGEGRAYLTRSEAGAEIRTPIRGRLHLTLRWSDEQRRSRCEVPDRMLFERRSRCRVVNAPTEN